MGSKGGVSETESLGRLGALGVVQRVEMDCGVQGCGKRGCMCLPCSAKRSASLLPSMVTCDGTVIQCTVRCMHSSSSRSCSQRGTLETGPEDPTQPRSFQRRAAPAAPRITYCESVHIPMSPAAKNAKRPDHQQEFCRVVGLVVLSRDMHRNGSVPFTIDAVTC